jgi:hypothetical protein
MKEMMFDDSAITPASIARSGLSLKGKLDALKIEFDINLAPPGGRRSAASLRHRIDRVGTRDRALKAGHLAPGFTLPDVDGHPVPLTRC